jgi:hypothetical protein
MTLSIFFNPVLCPGCREKELELRVAAAAPEPDKQVSQTPAHGNLIKTNGLQDVEMAGLIACKVDYPFIMPLRCDVMLCVVYSLDKPETTDLIWEHQWVII